MNEPENEPAAPELEPVAAEPVAPVEVAQVVEEAPAPPPRPTWRQKLKAAGQKAPLAALAFASAMAAGLIFESQAFFIFPWPVWINVDEPYITAFGWRMVEGSWLPYVDAVSHRGPVLYWMAAIFVKIFGPNWYATRLLGLSSFMATALGALWAGWRTKKPLAGIFGVLILAWASLVQFDPDHGVSFNGEPMLNAFALTAFAVLSSALALDNKKLSARKLFIAGVLTSCALLSKQVGAALVLPFTLWVLAAAAHRGPVLRSVGFFALGGIAPVLLTVLRFAIAGELTTFWYYLVVYNRDVYLAPYGTSVKATFRAWVDGNRVPFGIATALTLAWVARLVNGATSWRAAARRYDAMGFEITIFISLLVSALSSNGSLRGFPHYFLQLMPWAGLALGVLAHHIVGRLNGWTGAFAVLLLVGVPFVHVTDGWLDKQNRIGSERSRGQGWQANSDAPICAWLDKVTTPDDRIVVWGFRANIYVNCKRLPATRYVFTTIPAGVVPWDGGASAAVMAQRVVPGSQEILISEMEDTKAPVILDAATSMLHKQIVHIPALKKYVEANYCPAPQLLDLVVWRRKLADGSCPEAVK